MEQQSRFLSQTEYQLKKAFVLSVLEGMTISQAIAHHVRLNYHIRHDAYFSAKNFYGFLRSLKGSLFDESRSYTEEERLQYKALNLYGGLEYLRERASIIINYIEILEKEGQCEHH